MSNPQPVKAKSGDTAESVLGQLPLNGKPPPHAKYRATELGYAERFSDTYGHEIKFVPERDQWIECKNEVWEFQPGGDAPAMRKAFELAKIMGNECRERAVGLDPKPAEALLKRAVGMERAATIGGIVRLAKPMPFINAHLTGLDCDPMHLGTKSGVVDLRTLDVIPNGRLHMVSRSIPFEWTLGHECPVFEEFLATVMCYRADLVKLMRVWLGYLLIGHNDDKRFMVWYGERANNGKTTLWNVIRHVMGSDYTGILDKRLIVQSRNPAQFALSNVEGKRAVFASEPNRNSRLDVEWLKEFTGRETMTAERKGEQGYDFKPVGKLMLACNHLPSAQFDNALLDRMIAVPFEQSFYNEGEDEWREGDLPRDVTLEARMFAEAPGIISYLAKCCLEYQAEGLIKPIASRKLASDFQAENDYVGQWIAECCSLGADARAKTSDLFESYKRFCERIGIHVPGRMNEFSKRLESEPYVKKVIPGNVSHMSGIMIRDAQSDPNYWAGLN